MVGLAGNRLPCKLRRCVYKRQSHNLSFELSDRNINLKYMKQYLKGKFLCFQHILKWENCNKRLG
jgi:hypothetical protein